MTRIALSQIAASSRLRKRASLPWRGLGTIAIAALALAISPRSGLAQNVTEDWTHHHQVFPNPGTANDAVQNGDLAKWLRVVTNPRYKMQELRRHPSKTRRTRAVDSDSSFGESDSRDQENQDLEFVDRRADKATKRGKAKPTPTGDWSYFLGAAAGAGVGAGMYPAKFTQDFSTPSCTNDYAAFALNKAATTGTNPSIVAFNQLYSGPALAAFTIGNFMLQPATGVNFVIKNGATTLTITAGASNSGTTFTRSATVSTNATNFAAAVNRAGNGSSVGVSATANGTTVYLTATTAGTSGNSILVSSTAPAGTFLWSGVGLTGGNGTGLCGSGAPSVTWAYATSNGATPVRTSPVLSSDGTMIAFVEQGGASGAILHLLRPHAGDGTSGSTVAPIVPAHIVTNWNACTVGASCMINVAYSTSQNSNSSPFYDFTTDSIYVGDDGGVLHKISPIFNGGGTAPAVTLNLTVDAGAILTGPNLDYNSLNIFVGDSLGNAKYVRTSASSAGTCVSGVAPCVGSTTIGLGNANSSPGIADPPIVDGTNGKVYFIGGNGGSLGTNLLIVQANTTLGSVVQDAVGPGSGNGGHVTQGLHNGDFDNNFYNTGTGTLYVCGNTGSGNGETAGLFHIPVNSGALSATVGAGTLNLDTASAGECSPMTENFNSNSGIDSLFVSVPASAATDACLASTGCVMGFPITGWQASTAFVTFNQILDSNLNLQQVTTAGTSKTGAAPTWNVTVGGTTTDGTVTWTNLGNLYPTATASATGGTSGLIIDNDDASSQASSLYYSTLGVATCSTAGGGNVTACAVKRTQAGLQ